MVLRDTFTPKYVVRPFFDLFPEYEQVRVTTGWVRASTGETELVDERVATDPERFWDQLQTEAYGEIIRYVMDTQDGNPSGDNAPFFDAFRVDLRDGTHVFAKTHPAALPGFFTTEASGLTWLREPGALPVPEAAPPGK